MNIEIQPLSSTHVSSVTKLHMKYLSGFLTELGPRVVSFFYRVGSEMPENFGWVAVDGPDVVGLIFGSQQGAHLYKKIFLSRPLQSFWLGVYCLLTRPWWTLKTAYWFVQPPPFMMNSNVPELVYVMVDERYRRFGLAIMLFKNVFDYLRGQGVREFELSVAENNTSVRQFYERLGARCVKIYQEGGMNRCRYSLTVS